MLAVHGWQSRLAARTMPALLLINYSPTLGGAERALLEFTRGLAAVGSPRAHPDLPNVRHLARVPGWSAG